MEKNFVGLRHKLTFLYCDGIFRHLGGGEADLIGGAGLHDHEIVRGGVGVHKFEPHGLAGLLYWYALFPVHDMIFKGMLRGIARAAAVSIQE